MEIELEDGIKLNLILNVSIYVISLYVGRNYVLSDFYFSEFYPLRYCRINHEDNFILVMIFLILRGELFSQIPSKPIPP